MSKLAEALKQRRKAKGLTLQQLGNLSGVHTSYIGRVERGERYPSANILKKLAEPLGFGEIELFKLAGYLSRDDSDSQLEDLRKELNIEITRILSDLVEKIDDILGDKNF